MPCYIWSSIQAIRNMQSYATKGKGELRVINVSQTVRDDIMHITVLNWNSLQGNHQEWHHTHCTRPQAELWIDCKEWSLPGYNKNPKWNCVMFLLCHQILEYKWLLYDGEETEQDVKLKKWFCWIQSCQECLMQLSSYNLMPTEKPCISAW